MNLLVWATKWGVPEAALRDLVQVYVPENYESDGPASENRMKSLVRLEAADKGIFLYRNNVGAGRLENGSFVRWGLANDSERINAELKSADLIGIRRRLIVAADVGTHIGQFYSREVKRAGWKFTNSPEERAQLRWATHINAQGGNAAIVCGVGSL